MVDPVEFLGLGIAIAIRHRGLQSEDGIRLEIGS
jgi:hypothetical protein